MSVAYTITITRVATSQGDSLTDAVTRVEWRRVGVCSETGLSGRYSGITVFELNDISSDGFINYSDLTEATVKGWVQSSIDNDSEFETTVNNFIQRQIDNPPVVEQVQTTLPWSA